MQISKLAEKYEALSGLNDEQKRAVLELIDIKTETEMQTVLSEFRAEFAKIENKISHLERLVWGILIAVALAVISKYLG